MLTHAESLQRQAVHDRLTERYPAHPPEPATFSEVRYSHVAELRRKIAAGTYGVPAAQLADAILCAMHRNRNL